MKTMRQNLIPVLDQLILMEYHYQSNEQTKERIKQHENIRQGMFRIIRNIVGQNMDKNPLGNNKH